MLTNDGVNTTKRHNVGIEITQSSTSLYENVSVICATTNRTPPNEPYSINDTLIANDYMPLHKVANALQGSIMKVSRNETTNIIKIANKRLYKKHVTIYNNEEFSVHEDILKEMKILKYLTKKNPPRSLAKFVDFFQDNRHFFLVMEDAGDNLFDFVKECHQLIEKGLLALSVWHSFCQTAMQQMVRVVEWMHNKMHCCHLDISLENFAIRNIKMIIDKNTVRFNPNFQIKLIDFGLAEVFSDGARSATNGFKCSKYVGKLLYKSPEVFARKRRFDARSTDCWSLGVCFFMMIVGSPPFETPCDNDTVFKLFMKGEYVAVLSAWKRIHYVTVNVIDLIRKIFISEKYRFNITEIGKHPCLKKF